MLVGNLIVLDVYLKEFCGDFSNLKGVVEIVCKFCFDVIVNVVVYIVVDKVEFELELV